MATPMLPCFVRAVSLLLVACTVRSASRDPPNITYDRITAINPQYSYIDSSEYAKYDLVGHSVVALLSIVACTSPKVPDFCVLLRV